MPSWQVLFSFVVRYSDQIARTPYFVQLTNPCLPQMRDSEGEEEETNRSAQYLARNVIVYTHYR